MSKVVFLILILSATTVGVVKHPGLPAIDLRPEPARLDREPTKPLPVLDNQQ